MVTLTPHQNQPNTQYPPWQYDLPEDHTLPLLIPRIGRIAGGWACGCQQAFTHQQKKIGVWTYHQYVMTLISALCAPALQTSVLLPLSSRSHPDEPVHLTHVQFPSRWANSSRDPSPNHSPSQCPYGSLLVWIFFTIPSTFLTPFI